MPIDSPLAPLPPRMISIRDLVIWAIAFLLVTVVWVTNSHSDTAGSGSGEDQRLSTLPARHQQKAPNKLFHVLIRRTDVSLGWRSGTDIISDRTVPKAPLPADGADSAILRYPDLGAAIEEEWRRHSDHMDEADNALDSCVIHVDDATPFHEFSGVLDAIRVPTRGVRLGAEVKRIPVFNMKFSAP